MRSFSHVLNCLLLVGVAGAQDFSIQFASPVAAQSYQMKRSAFVFRTVGCAEDVKPEVTATAEGRVEGHRRSVQLKIAQAHANPNVFGIFREWPSQGIWIVNIKARCAPRSASALVATDAKGLVRESSKVLDRFATEAEIEALLNTGKKTEGRID